MGRAGGSTVSWRRGRDSNPRYALRAYNGLANRRLQPLGHVSLRAGMPETRSTGKRMYTNPRWAEHLNWLANRPCIEPSGVIGRAGFHSGITGDARHDDLKQRPHAGKPRGA